jgi:DtxR family transcriptional regulator, Mn-dependent transcriptional regulator
MRAMPDPEGSTAKSGRDAPPRPSLRRETIDHYLETIYYIAHEEAKVRPSRIAEWLGVTAPTVSVSLQRLANDSWLRISPDRSVVLTPKGSKRAEAIVRTHRILERWLTDVLGLDWASADAEAQRLAPATSARVAEPLDELLGHPATCPHGNVIPGRTPPYGELVSLSELPARTPAHVRRVSEVAEHDAPQLLRQLHSYGLVTGAPVQVADVHDSVEAVPVEIGDRTVALGTKVAGLIWVEVDRGAGTDWGAERRRRTVAPPSLVASEQ